MIYDLMGNSNKIKDSSLRIRLLSLEDEEKLFSFFSSLSEKATKWYSPHLFDRATVKDICQGKDEKYKRVVVLHENKIIGYCVLFFGVRRWDGFRYKNKLIEDETCTISPCVSDDFQHKGIGTEMMKYVIGMCSSLGKKIIILWGGVVSKNTKAVNFYKKLNFKIDREWKHPKKKVLCYDMHFDINVIEDKTKRNVLVIGAAGSLGQEICNLLLKDNYYVVADDIDENNLMHLYRTYDIPIYLEDIRNFIKMSHIIEHEDIDIVVNCAASKHVKWCEYNIKNAINLNILSNLELMNYLKKEGKQFIFISSDKATNPTNIYALTKQFVDYIVHFFGFKLVRGVNFLNSNGSVLGIWDYQRKRNLPFSLVKEDCKRYFITVSQMSSLVVDSIKDNDNSKVEYTPYFVYNIHIKKLFEAYLRFHKIITYEVKNFNLDKHEKLMENIDFEPIVKELDSVEDIVNLLKCVYNRS